MFVCAWSLDALSVFNISSPPRCLHHGSSSRRHWRRLDEILTRQPDSSEAATCNGDYASLEQHSKSSSPTFFFHSLSLISLFLSKQWSLLSMSSLSLSLSFRQSSCFSLRYLPPAADCPSWAAGSRQESPGDAGQPHPWILFSTHGTVSCRRPSSSLLWALTGGLMVQMVACTVRLPLPP